MFCLTYSQWTLTHSSKPSSKSLSPKAELNKALFLPLGAYTFCSKVYFWHQTWFDFNVLVFANFFLYGYCFLYCLIIFSYTEFIKYSPIYNVFNFNPPGIFLYIQYEAEIQLSSVLAPCSEQYVFPLLIANAASLTKFPYTCKSTHGFSIPLICWSLPADITLSFFSIDS